MRQAPNRLTSHERKVLQLCKDSETTGLTLQVVGRNHANAGAFATLIRKGYIETYIGDFLGKKTRLFRILKHTEE